MCACVRICFLCCEENVLENVLEESRWRGGDELEMKEEKKRIKTLLTFLYTHLSADAKQHYTPHTRDHGRLDRRG